MFKDEFQIVVDEVTRRCQEYFLNRLYAVYLTGSVSTDEAIIGESDLDCWVIITGNLNNNDNLWVAKTSIEIDKKYDVVNGVHINVKTVEELQEDMFARFALKYNSILYFGKDVISEIEFTGADTYKPDKTIAKQRLSFAQNCLKEAINNKCPQCIDKIPENAYFAARKYARYFILVEGAYFLMSKDKFETFKQERVIQQLKDNCAGFDDILDISASVLKDPLTTAINSSDYIIRIYPFVEFLFNEIDRA